MEVGGGRGGSKNATDPKSEQFIDLNPLIREPISMIL